MGASGDTVYGFGVMMSEIVTFDASTPVMDSAR
jgi:hypothetical protein